MTARDDDAGDHEREISLMMSPDPTDRAGSAAAHRGTDANTGTVAHLAQLARSFVPTIHPAGRPVIAGVAATVVALRVVLRIFRLKRLSRLVGKLTVPLTAGSALFFRVPDRTPPADPLAVVAPADGLVTLITEAAPPVETGLGSTPRPRVSIFLSVFDVHVQFAPIAGRVLATHYHPGKFLSADLDKASEANERNSLVIGVGDSEVVATQIAGLVARRIICDAQPGDRLAAGEIYGLIRFGSRLDVYLPVGTEPQVRIGQRAVGGETVLARLAPGAGAS